MFELISRNPSRYYLAYGSNLDMERMGKRCPYAVVVGTTEIKGYRLLFKKSKTGFYATIEQDANESVPAVVWKLSEYDELLLDRYEGFTGIACKLRTGRTHQIRVHMAYIGHPVAGDPVYGPRNCITSLRGQCLHAKTLGFVHPATGEHMEFDSELPEYFTHFLKTLRRLPE